MQVWHRKKSILSPSYTKNKDFIPPCPFMESVTALRAGVQTVDIFMSGRNNYIKPKPVFRGALYKVRYKAWCIYYCILCVGHTWILLAVTAAVLGRVMWVEPAAARCARETEGKSGTEKEGRIYIIRRRHRMCV